MYSFQLFKVRVRVPDQESFIYPERTPADILRAVIDDRPSVELRVGYSWHLGNVTIIGNDGIYFAFGRTTRSIMEMWNEDKGEFVEVQFDTAPYTHVVFDLRNQVAAIAAKSKLAPHPRGIAKKLEQVLSESGHAKTAAVSFEVTPLSDPRDFINHLRSAYAVHKFTMSFSRPNPIDAEELFHKPMEKLLQKVEGRKGETTLEGDDLDRETLAALTRSVAATGDDAKAKIKPAEDARPILKRLSGDSITVSVSDLDQDDAFVRLIVRIREIYCEVRQPDFGDQ